MTIMTVAKEVFKRHAQVWGQQARRTYLTGPPFREVSKLPAVSRLLDVATFQRGGEGEAGNCEVHHGQLAGSALNNIQQENQTLASYVSNAFNYFKTQISPEETNTPAESSQSLPGSIIPTIPDQHIKSETNITAANIRAAVEESGMALLRLYGIADAYGGQHMVVVAGVFTLGGKEHAILIDCDPLKQDPGIESGEKLLKGDEVLADLSVGELRSPTAKVNPQQSMVRIVEVDEMLKLANSAWHGFKSDVEAEYRAKSPDGELPEIPFREPAILSVDPQYLEKNMGLTKDKRDKIFDKQQVQNFGEKMKGYMTQIEFSAAAKRTAGEHKFGR